MTNKELVEISKQAINDLRGTYGTNTACECLRLFCERVERTKEIVDLINQISSVATNNIKGGEKENDGDWYKQTGVLLSNKEALDIAKFIPLYCTKYRPLKNCYKAASRPKYPIRTILLANRPLV